MMLSLAEAVIDREVAELVPAAGSCVACAKRTGANAFLFDDNPQDDCLDGKCFHSKVTAHIGRQKQTVEGLVQITRAY